MTTTPSDAPDAPDDTGVGAAGPQDTVRLIDPPMDTAVPPAPPAPDVGSPAGNTPLDGPAPSFPPPPPPSLAFSFAFNRPTIPGQGEDADPLLQVTADVTIVGVFDGMGGAGGRTYATPDGPRTGAYLASRLVRDVAQGMLSDLLDAGGWDPERVAAEVHDAVRAALEARLDELKAPPSGLRSTLIRALPTTMAVAVARRCDPDDALRWECTLLWAGDSRIYLLDPVEGLSQLTVDDLRERGDAMANLTEDSVMSNAISAETPFAVRQARVTLTEPFALIAATDGCFGYLPTPMHFEHLLLASQRDSVDGDEWAAHVARRVDAVTGDDAAMAVAVRGADHATLRAMCDERFGTLENEWVRPLDVLAIDVRRRETELEILQNEYATTTAALWDTYKPGYERQLPQPATETP